MNDMDRWVAAACAELQLDPAGVDTRMVLDLARDVAHNVLRPGAPVTTYLLGLAVGRGAAPADAAARLSGLALTWSDGDDLARPAGDGTPSDGGVAPPAGAPRPADLAAAGDGLAPTGGAAPVVPPAPVPPPGAGPTPVMPPAGAAEGTAG